MYCRNCGAEVGSEQRHCRKCGAKQPVDGDAGEASVTGDGFAVITYIFIGICLFLMFIAGLKMMADDNYLGLIPVILGFACLIYGLYWSQHKRIDHHRKNELESDKQLHSEDVKLLAANDEQFSVTEATTRKLEAARLNKNR